MTDTLSPNAQAILLLTAPLISGRRDPSYELLTPGEYKRLARFLRELQREPAGLLGAAAETLLEECRHVIATERVKSLLDRGFLLAQAVERWHSRAIWVMSRADATYPQKLKVRLRDDAPALLYGCGDASLLELGGLAVVGSRNVDDELVAYTERIGRSVADAGQALVSGGARGIDQAAMRGALEAGGRVSGVLADSLERAAMNREHRDLLMDGRLVLVSPYDPMAGFNVGNAMQRNKVIYALSDAALVVSSDEGKGGTWSGAVEQLEKLRLVPVYVRVNGTAGGALEALRRKGALPWPEPATPEELIAALHPETSSGGTSAETQMAFSTVKDSSSPSPQQDVPDVPPQPPPSAADADSDEQSFTKARSLLETMETAKTADEIAAELNVTKDQARLWLDRLVKEDVLEKLTKPTRYRASGKALRLF